MFTVIFQQNSICYVHISISHIIQPN